MAYTYSKIASVTVGSGGSSSIDFIAIPQNYTDLLLKVSVRSANDTVYAISFNSNTSNYSGRTLRGSGAATASYQTSDYSYGTTAIGIGYVSSAASTFVNADIYIPNYASSNNKSLSMDSVSEQNTASPIYMNLTAGLWSNAAAINSIKLDCANAQGFIFAQYSTATLYGIKAEV
jgi:hypothetical protein